MDVDNVNDADESNYDLNDDVDILPSIHSLQQFPSVQRYKYDPLTHANL